MELAFLTIVTFLIFPASVYWFINIEMSNISNIQRITLFSSKRPLKIIYMKKLQSLSFTEYY